MSATARLAIVALVLTTKTHAADPPKPPTPFANRVLDAVAKAVDEKKCGLPPAWEERITENGAKTLCFPIALGPRPSEFPGKFLLRSDPSEKQYPLDYVTRRSLEFLAITRGLTDKTYKETLKSLSEKAQKDVLNQSIALSMSFRQLLEAQIAALASGEFRKMPEYDHRIESLLVGFGRSVAQERGMSLTMSEFRSLGFMTKIKTDPGDAVVYYLPSIDFITLQQMEKVSDTPDTWREIWREAASKERRFAGRYYFRVLWDKDRVHRSGEVTIDSDGKTLEFRPD